MIPTNVLYRVFQIKIGATTGTCFAIDVEDRQYLVTARHIIDEWDQKTPVQIFYEQSWKNVQFALVGKSEVDVAVLAPPRQLSPNFAMPATEAGLAWGQDVYFLGFPYGWSGDIGSMNRNFPMPFVKKAIVSLLTVDGSVSKYFLDGHNNLGFSGGPVVFKERNCQDFKVAAVVSAYRYVDMPTFLGDSRVPLTYRENTGIIVAYGIKHATDLITKNPIGCKI